MAHILQTVLIGHYPNDCQSSMERFDAQIIQHLRSSGGNHQKWNPPVFFGRIKCSSTGLGKWLGYLDKFLLFPLIIVFRLQFRVKNPKETLFILPDHSHGIYVPLFKPLPHVVHVHDLIAIRSSRNDFFDQELSTSGRIYQRLISSGLKQAKYFICISRASQNDLNRYISPKSACIQVVHNELNFPYRPTNKEALPKDIDKNLLTHSYLMHVGNSLWYKNRRGVLQIYKHYVSTTTSKTAPKLIIVGAAPTIEDNEFLDKATLKGNVIFLQNIENETLQFLYSNAIGLLFPSHYEGFGWPIIEALACGCPVMTTERAPMSEIGEDVANYIQPMPEECNLEAFENWLISARKIINNWNEMTPSTKADSIQKRIEHAQKFRVGTAFKQYLRFYERIQTEASFQNERKGE